MTTLLGRVGVAAVYRAVRERTPLNPELDTLDVALKGDLALVRQGESDELVRILPRRTVSRAQGFRHSAPVEGAWQRLAYWRA